MKKIRLLPVLIILAFVTISCSLFSPKGTQPGDSSQDYQSEVSIPVVDYEASGEPVNVTVTLEENDTTSETITPEGGKLTLNASDGSMYTLEIPAGALEIDTPISMTAVKSMEGAPLESGPVFAVQLEPSGLFFKEILTLTIIPAQEIPIENQIIFGYEGTGQDYHLAVVDPKSREIKVKLLSFSGAGVGSGGDKEWAATLQAQAAETTTQLTHKLGELLQAERQNQILGHEGNAELGKIIKSSMDQYVDQVLQKGIAASELDCKYAWETMQKILGAERQSQLLGLYTNEQGENAPIMNDISGKIERLSKIAAECKRGYTITGGADEFSGTGSTCDIKQPFTVSGSGVTVTFTPSSFQGGSYSYSGSMSDIEVSGGGNYKVIYQDGIAISIQAGGDGSAGGASGSGDEFYTLTLLPEDACE